TELSSVCLKPIEGRHHGGKNSGEENSNLFDRMEVEVVGVVNGFPSRKIGGRGGGNHQGFAQKKRFVNENRHKRDGQKAKISQTLKLPFLMHGFAFTHCFGGAPEV